MLYPANMDQHGPARSIEEYLAYLYDELDAAPQRSARALDMTARIVALEAEIDGRGDL